MAIYQSPTDVASAVPDATASVKGKVELATDAEAIAICLGLRKPYY